MKKRILAFILLFGITATSTQLIPTKNSFNFSGCYVGSFIGYSQTRAKSIDTFQTDYNNANLQAMNGLQTKTTLSGRNARIGFYGGYGYQYRSLYLGAEVEGILQNIKNSQKTTMSRIANNALSTHNIAANLKNSYALSLKGGYIFNPGDLLYLKVGIISSRWNISSDYPSFANSAIVKNPTYTTSKRQFGLLLGTGIEKAINNNFIAGAEISYAQYKKISYNHPRMNQSSISPSTFSFSLKLSYKI